MITPVYYYIVTRLVDVDKWMTRMTAHNSIRVWGQAVYNSVDSMPERLRLGIAILNMADVLQEVEGIGMRGERIYRVYTDETDTSFIYR